MRTGNGAGRGRVLGGLLRRGEEKGEGYREMGVMGVMGDGGWMGCMFG